MTIKLKYNKKFKENMNQISWFKNKKETEQIKEKTETKVATIKDSIERK